MANGRIRSANGAAGDGSRRTLGDAWRDWDPTRAATVGDTRAAQSLFLGLITLISIVGAAAVRALFWLAEPRLTSLGIPSAPLRVVGLGVAALTLLAPISLWMVPLNIRPPRFVARLQLSCAIVLWPLARAAARVTRVSRDRLGHAFVLLLNQLAPRARRIPADRGLLVLAPRCLAPDMRRRLQELAAAAGAQVEIGGGGEQALAALNANGPGAVLAVACERDLVAGLRDVAPAITVLGLPNRRPEGPCRNSEIDLDEARRMLARLRSLLTRE